MQLGMIGLGRMGNGMTDRLREHGHDVQTYDPKVESRTAGSLEELKGQLEAPRAFTKMVHNGIEYGLMQAYAEGFEIIEHSEFDVDLHELSGIWRYGSVVRSWLLELLHTAFEEHGNKLDDIAPWVEDSGEGRWTIA